MALRLIHLAATATLCLFSGCDENNPPPAPAATAPATAAAPAAEAGVNLSGPRERIALGAIPFSIEAPPGWQLQPGATGRVVLHGRIPSGGEVDVLLGTGPVVKADVLPLLLKQSAKPSNDKHVRNEVVQRDDMTLITSIAPTLPPNTPTPSDPALVPMGWSVQCLVTGGQVDYSTYELDVLGLSQEMFDRDALFIQQIMNSLKYEAAATRPTTP